MKNRFLITLGLAFTVLLLTAASAEAKHWKHKHFRNQWYGGGYGNQCYGGPGNGNRVAFTGHPVFGYNHPGNGAFHPVYGVTGKKSVLGNVIRAVRYW